MTFGTRLTLWLVIPIVLLTAAFGLLDERRSRARIRDELRREGRAITLTVQLALEDALRDRQLSDVEDLVEEITGFERVYGIRIFTPDGTLRYQSDPLKEEPFLAEEALRGVLRTRQPAETVRRIGDQNVLTYIVPLRGQERTLLGAVQLLQLESFTGEEVRASRNSIIGLTVILVAVTGFMAVVVTRIVVSRPIDGFVDGIRAMDPARMEERLPARGGAELERLAQEFNRLFERLEKTQHSLRTEQAERRETENQLKSAERLAALGQMAAGLAHEIGTPLNVITGRTDQLLRRWGDMDPALQKNLKTVSAQINRITRIVQEMLEFARAKDLHVAPTDVPAVIRDVLDFVDHELERAHIRYTVSTIGEIPAISADGDQIYEVFLNVILNAADAMPDGGAIQVEIERRRPEGAGEGAVAGDYLVIRVTDSGAGIAPADLERVFDPFFTTKPVGKGTGLGMSVSYGVVREHGGWIDVESEAGRGTRVQIYLPVVTPAASRVREVTA